MAKKGGKKSASPKTKAACIGSGIMELILWILTIFWDGLLDISLTARIIILCLYKLTRPIRRKLRNVLRGIKYLIGRRKSVKGNVVKGSPNLGVEEGGNCYFNAILQNLLAMDILRDYFVESVDDSFSPFSFSASMRKLFLESNVQPGILRGHLIHPELLYRSICSMFPDKYRPEAGSYPRLLLKDLVVCLSNEEFIQNRSVVDTMFRVEHATVSTCLKSGRTSVSYKTRLFLRLDVPYSKLQSTETYITSEWSNCSSGFNNLWHRCDDFKVADIPPLSIESCLDSYMTPKYQTAGKSKSRSKSLRQRTISCLRTNLRKLGKLSTTSCKKLFKAKRDAVNITLIHKAPPILIIELNYVMDTNRHGSYNYNNNLESYFDFLGRVKFGETLDLKPYMVPSCNDTNDTYMYRLVGLGENICCSCRECAHAFAYVRGNTANGHYAWYYVSDDDVWEVPAEKVLSCKADILFYERC